MTLGLSNWREWPKDSYRNLDVSSGRLDAAIVIDSRSIPEKKLISISIRLLEPHNFPAIDRLIRGLGNVTVTLGNSFNPLGVLYGNLASGFV